MRDAPILPVTLVIADCQPDVHVIGFSGLDALNEVYRYDVDLVSEDPHLHILDWPGRDAFLCFGPPQQGIHGRVIAVAQQYAGTCLSHYRLTLGPSLQLLDGRPQRRLHPEMAAPELITRLLQAHGIEPCAYRFDNPVGLYPRQAAWVQWDETDLHFLHRICEEAGLHFRFEHAPDRHVLIFADDPATFPLHLPPLHFAPDEPAPALRHLAQLWTLPANASHSSAPLAANVACNPPALSGGLGQAINEEIDEPAVVHPTDISSGLKRQRGIRELERLRCERRLVQGRSNRADLHSGRVIQVQGHPESLLNDQWLIINMRHCARQLDALEGCDPHDIAAIVASAESATSRTDQEPLMHGYRNSFDALPWSLGWRPPLKHARPKAFGEQCATVMDGRPDAQGRVPVRFDWQIEHGDFGRQPRLMAHVLETGDPALDALRTGSRVVVAHVDGNPERPVICGAISEPERSALNLHLDGVQVDPPPGRLQSQGHQHLHLEAFDALTLHGTGATVELDRQQVKISGPQALQAAPLCEAPDGARAIGDLRLTRQAGLQGEALAHCAWYIVRMARPGFEHLARVDPDQILFEGTTDAEGYLGLTPLQLRQLARLYNSQPYALCLVHPQQCLTLHGWLEQNWTTQQRQAFRLSGL